MHPIDRDQAHPAAAKREPVSLLGGVDWRDTVHHLRLEVHRITDVGDSIDIDPRSVCLFNEQTAVGVVFTALRHHDRRHYQLVVSNGITNDGPASRPPEGIESKRDPCPVQPFDWRRPEILVGRKSAQAILELVDGTEEREDVEEVLVPGMEHELMKDSFDIRARIAIDDAVEVGATCFDLVVGRK